MAAEFQQELLQAVEYFESLLPLENAWSLKHSSSNVNVFKRKPMQNNKIRERSILDLYAASCIIKNVVPEAILPLIQNPENWDQFYDRGSEAAQISSETTLNYVSMKPLDKLVKRPYDFAVCNHVYATQNSKNLLSFSVLTPLLPSCENKTRIKLVLGAWKVESIGNDSKVTFILQCNIKPIVSSSNIKKFMLNRVSYCIQRVQSVLLNGHSIEGTTPPPSPIRTNSVIETVQTDPLDASIIATDLTESVLLVEPNIEPPLEIEEPAYEFLPTHESAVKALEYFLTLTDESHKGFWNHASTQHDVRISIYNDPSFPAGSLPIVRGETVWKFDGNGDAIENFLFVVTSVEARQTWDPRFERSELVSWLNPCEKIAHSFMKPQVLPCLPQFPVSGRDIFVLQSRFTRDDAHYLIQTSVPHITGHAPGNGYVRAELKVACWELKRDSLDPEKIHVNFVVDINPKGSIPTRVTQTPLCVAGVIDFIETYGIPMQITIVSPSIEFKSQKTSGTTYECYFEVIEPKGHVQFNICKKLYPYGANVICENTDLVSILVDGSGDFFRCYPQGAGRVFLRVVKRVLDGSRSIDDSIHLNGTLMHIDGGNGKILIPKMISKKSSAVLMKRVSAVPSIRLKPSKKTPLMIVDKKRVNLRTAAQIRAYTIKHSLKATIESSIWIHWMFALLVIPLYPDLASSYFTLESLELTATCILLAKAWVLFKTSPTEHASASLISGCMTWAALTSRIMFEVLFDMESMKAVATCATITGAYFFISDSGDENSNRRKGSRWDFTWFVVFVLVSVSSFVSNM